MTVARCRELVARTDAELDAIDALPDGPERAERFAKVNGWLTNEWLKVDWKVRREALR